MKSNCFWIAVVFTVALVGPVWAQDEGEAAAPAPQDGELAALLEDVTVLRGVKPLQLTRAQLAQLVPRLQAGQERLRQVERAEAAGWVTAARTLRQAIPQAASGAPARAAEADYLRVQQTARGKREAARDQTRNEVRALLERILTPAQKSALLATGRAEIARQRLSRLESGDLRRIEGLGRTLDRLREASPQDYPRERQRFAMQMAGMPGWWEIGRERRLAIRPEARRGRGGDGLQREERRLRRERFRVEARQQLADPARQAQMRQFLALADQVRALPPQTYQQRRTALATQLYQTQSQTRAQTAPPEQAMNAFIERYLLLPRAPVALQERLQALGG